jgi:hypothetical protein
LARTAAPAVPLIRDSGISLDKAEVKNRISDFYVALADLKMEAADVREPMVQKDAGIAELAALELKPILVRQNDGYYEKMRMVIPAVTPSVPAVGSSITAPFTSLEPITTVTIAPHAKPYIPGTGLIP